MLKEFKILSNTEFERIALLNRVNLSDGHARQNLSESRKEIITKIFSHIDVLKSKSQVEIEAEFLNMFFQCAKQIATDNFIGPFLNYSSSCAIKIASQLCRIRGLKVLLIEPCFDNIRHILITEGVEIFAIGEDELMDLDYLDLNINSDTAVWIVQPNNPTGFCLEQNLFKKLIDIISKKKATIIIDFCFRFFAPNLYSWNQYSYLINSNVSFVCIEDTGKTWSFVDNKVGVTVCSEDNYKIIHRLHDELLLNVSPLVLTILSEFIKDSIVNGLYKTVLKEIESNRLLIHNLANMGLIKLASKWSQNVPMELLELPKNIPATFFWSKLRENGVDVLPALNYFWSKPMEGLNLFRIPLSRPVEDFEIAIPIIKNTITNLIK